jgi:hypothetical protein
MATRGKPNTRASKARGQGGSTATGEDCAAARLASSGVCRLSRTSRQWKLKRREIMANAFVRRHVPSLAARALARRAARSSIRVVTASRACRSPIALSQLTAKLIVCKLVLAAAKTWRRLQGQRPLPKVIDGVTFRNGVEETPTPSQRAA